MLILFQGNTYLYQRMPDKVTEYFLFLNTPGVISGLFLCRLLAREGLTFPNIYYLFRILEEKGHKSRPNFFIISRTVYHYFSRVGRQEKCRFQESIIFNNRASYISKRKINIIANGEKENCNYILLFLSLPDILLKSIKVVSKSARKKACSSTTFVVYLKSATTRLYDTEAKIICIVSKKGAQCIECHHKDI